MGSESFSPAGLLALSLALLLGACGSPPPSSPTTARTLGAQASAVATIADWRWLGRASFGADTASLERLQRLGRARFLDEQLAAELPPDPPAVAGPVAAMPISQLTGEQRWRAARAERQRINTLPTDEEKQAARMALNKLGGEAVQDTQARHLLRALFSPAQLREQMTWFWMNHFSVYSGKADLRWTLADYEERVVRPRAFGKFNELVMATLTSPAMLEYLDNAQSAAGRVNENHARELLELHTLGVSGGPSGSRYTQQDVQELARVLTGVGLRVNEQPPKLSPQRQAQYLAEGLLEFNPNRHDFGPKVLLGQAIAPVGFGEVAQAVALLSREPATARFISAKLAAYFVADTPPPALVSRMAHTFERTDGDIAAVLRTLFLSPEMEAAAGDNTSPRKFKDPMQFVVSSLRLAYEGRTITSTRPAINWLAQLGEPLYGRVSPDGYPTGEAAWASSGQMVKRFEIARNLANGPANLFIGPDGKPGQPPGPPLLTTPLYHAAIEPTLSPATRSALAQTTSQAEWNATLLSSPEWMQR